MKNILVIILCLCAFTVSAQDVVTHGYDASGNRIYRSPVQDYFSPVHISHTTNGLTGAKNQKAKKTDSLFTDVTHSNEILKKDSAVGGVTGMDITVFPNPTTGLIRINLSDVIDGTPNKVFILFDRQGNLLQKYSQSQGNFSIDMSALSAGVYILECISGSYLKKVSIVKQ